MIRGTRTFQMLNLSRKVVRMRWKKRIEGKLDGVAKKVETPPEVKFLKDIIEVQRGIIAELRENLSVATERLMSRNFEVYKTYSTPVEVEKMEDWGQDESIAGEVFDPNEVRDERVAPTDN